MKESDNPTVFPVQTNGTTRAGQYGLHLRDYFAAKAMQGLIVASNIGDSALTAPYCSATSEEAYAIADAMLKEREKE